MKFSFSLLISLCIASIFSCVPTKKQTDDLNDSSISAVVGNMVKPDAEIDLFIYRLLCGDVHIAGEAYETNGQVKVSFTAETGKVKVGDKCRLETWGQLIDSKFQYNTVKENLARYHFTAFELLSEQRTLKFHYVKDYKDKSNLNDMQVLFSMNFEESKDSLGDLFDLMASDSTQILHCKLQNELIDLSGLKEKDDTKVAFKFDMKKSDFKQSETIQCESISVFINSSEFVYLFKEEEKLIFNNSPSDPVKWQIKLTEKAMNNPQPVVSIVFSEIFAGNWQSTCEVNGENEYKKIYHEIQFDASDADTGNMKYFEKTYSDINCSENSETSLLNSKSATFKITGLKADNIGIYNVEVKLNDKIYYSLISRTEDVLKIASDLDQTDDFWAGSSDLDAELTLGDITFSK